MAMKKSIGRTLAHIDVAANTSVRIHEDFFNSHPCYQHLSYRSPLSKSVPASQGMEILGCSRLIPTKNSMIALRELVNSPVMSRHFTNSRLSYL
jgi:hypothetical protein